MQYLKAKGLIGYGRRSGTSHEVWDYPKDQRGLPRPIVIRPEYAEIPARHIQTSLVALGIDYKTFELELIELGLVKRKGGKKK
jgi:hypothetical protein